MQPVTRAQLAKQAQGHGQYGKVFLPAEYFSDLGPAANAQGPASKKPVVKQPMVADAAVFCGVCDASATPASEPTLTFPNTAYGSTAGLTSGDTPPRTITSQDPFVAVNQLKDQGCFSIIACINGITLPAALPSPGGSNWKVCGDCGNFLDRENDTGTNKSLFTATNAAGTDALHVTPVVNPAGVCASGSTVAAIAIQRDLDHIRFTVPAGGWTGFRVYFTAAFPYDCALVCNKNFPSPGTIASCASGNSAVPNEYGWVPVFGGDPSFSDAGAADGTGEGNQNTTLAFPRSGTATLPEGDYMVYIRVASNAEARWTTQGGPFLSGSAAAKYQIQIQGTAGTVGGSGGVGACCNTTSGACSALTEAACTTAAGQYRGEGSSCSSLATPCIFPTCSGDAEGAECVTQDGDPNVGCSDANFIFSFQNINIPATGGTKTVCGHDGTYQDSSGGTPVNTTDTDWYSYTALDGTQTAENKVVMSLESDGGQALGIIYDLDPNGLGVCGDIYGFIIGNAYADKLSLELCVPAGMLTYAYIFDQSNVNCSATTGNRYIFTTTITNNACTAGACCSAAGACTSVTGSACYAAGGVFYGEAVLCSAVTCCNASICDAGATAEAALPNGAAGSPCFTVADELNGDTTTNTDSNSGCALGSDGVTVVGSQTLSTVNPNQTVCGVGSMGRNAKDQDWYAITLTSTNYLGVIAKSSYDMDMVIYKGITGGCTGGGESDLVPLAFGEETAAACAGTNVVGDCLEAGLYWVVVRPSFDNFYGVPCNAKYNVQFFVGLCGGTITCDAGATAEGETNCQTTFDGGCNNDTITSGSFITVACNQKYCGTYDATNGLRDTDWYSWTGSGNVTISVKGEAYTEISVYKKGTSADQGCTDATFVNGLTLINPNTTGTLTLTGLASGTYYIIVAADFDGPNRVCCGAKYQLSVACTPACACSANITDTGSPPCVVNTVDLGILLSHFGQTVTTGTNGDICGSSTVAPPNGVVNSIDLGLLLSQFGKTGTSGSCI